MKRVSFKVAKAIKEAGYPQELKEGTAFYCENGLKDRYDSELYELFDPMYCVRPYAMEVWLWLWREKHIALETYVTSYDRWTTPIDICFKYDEYSDPEEAIENAIEYLVDNKLLK